MEPLSIIASGMVTGVGMTAPETCAAIRCGINPAEETRFMDDGGEWIMGVQVPLAQPWRGRAKLIHLVVPAIKECLNAFPDFSTENIPLLLCVAELGRPGQLTGLDETLLTEIQVELGQKFHPESTLIAKGKIGGAVALQRAHQLLSKKQCSACLIAGVDSLLIGETLKAYEIQSRLLTSNNSDGFIPGEAGSAVLVARGVETPEKTLHCLGLGFGQELATVNAEEPLRAEGLVTAIGAACTNAQVDLGQTDYRITDISGEQYSFKEAALALTRILRTKKNEYDIWHPADSLGEIGAAIGPAILSVLLAAIRKSYTPGQTVLGHMGNADGARAAMILRPNHKRQT